MSAVVLAKQVARWYGQVLGLNDLSVSIATGITGLLGPNGAGKSTFLKLVTGQLRPSRGELTVLGHRAFGNRKLFRRLGFVPEHDALYDDLRGGEFVSLCLEFHGYSAREARRRADFALERVALVDVKDRRVSGYSKGMRQRLKIAQAIGHEPELLVLDEPFNGLDPVGRAEMMSLLRQLRDQGTSILLSTHILHEVEAMTDRVLLLHRGRAIAQGTVREIRGLLDRYPHRLRMKLRDPRRMALALIREGHASSTRVDEATGTLEIETVDLDALQKNLAALVARERPGIRAIECTDMNLEALFDYLVG